LRLDLLIFSLRFLSTRTARTSKLWVGPWNADGNYTYPMSPRREALSLSPTSGLQIRFTANRYLLLSNEMDQVQQRSEKNPRELTPPSLQRQQVVSNSEVFSDYRSAATTSIPVRRSS